MIVRGYNNNRSRFEFLMLTLEAYQIEHARQEGVITDAEAESMKDAAINEFLNPPDPLDWAKQVLGL